MSVTTQKDLYRYERKLPCHQLSKAELKFTIKHHSSHFKTLYPKRQVNNIYFDTKQFCYYHHNKIGIAERKKFRIRWYGPCFGAIDNPILEMKVKNGLVGFKRSWTLNPFVLNKDCTQHKFKDLFISSQLPEEIENSMLSLEPVMVNSYQREYYQSHDHAYRLTLDDELKFFQLGVWQNSFANHFQERSLLVTELKYGLQDETKAQKICSEFPMRVERCSKYILGLERLALVDEFQTQVI